ncbi:MULTISPECIES: hypothetical protein [Agrobacterium]|uniref:hypothetical protein n=1 Tax=Agrobacterium TaxID=357 RepID=UPI001572B84B|nr:MULTISPECIES: hypothetical protein [Agrobacterium]MCD4660808.1 hypothetical protein [Agrobacterium sp.]NTE54350.1 hypothetical protein [Agrobacterium tumefaciens]NTE70515.1 hypothetical protein [Agrobacterium tumefaciens]
MTPPFTRRRPFADFEAPRPAGGPQARPVEAGIKSRIVILKCREDGTIFERSARPAFLFRDPSSPTEKYKLPTDYFWRGSAEHLARRRELGLE